MTKLDRCWKNQLRMSGDLAKASDGTDRIYTYLARKNEWLRAHHFTRPRREGCFFCDYTKVGYPFCSRCPGKQVDPRFVCMTVSYHFRRKPKEFYAELLRLDAIRRSNP